jgi:type II secretory ATPase GspE/PulE/Tfp pilus assembly ATPase PilB-like protein
VLLACGPAQSGTTTTASAILRAIDTYLYTFYSIADPGSLDLTYVESYRPNPNETLAKSLRRCAHLFEPNVIFLNPIRDAETAKVVFSCEDEVTLVSELSARDAANGILQLLRWTGSPKLVADRLLGLCSQRLVRLLCPDCKQRFRPNPAILSTVGLPPSIKQLYRTPRKTAAGAAADKCRTCGGSGYSGRTGLFEFVRMSDSIRQLVTGQPTAAAIRNQARKEKMPRFQQSALKLVVDGATSVDEVQRVFHSG